MNDYLLIVLATLATASRVLGLIGLSIVTGWFLGYAAIKDRVFENFYVSMIEVLESIPVVTFFPIVLIFFVEDVGGKLGVELAADFLIFTAVVWNIWMGIYQAYKTVPKEMVEVFENYRLGFLGKLINCYIPFSMPRIAASLFPSAADGFFYITVSEVFSIGTTSFSAFGIGSVIQELISARDFQLVYFALAVMGVMIVGLTLALRELSQLVVARYTLDTDVPIRRRGRLRLRYSARLSAVMSRAPLTRLSVYLRRQRVYTSKEVIPMPVEEDRGRGRTLRYIRRGIAAVILAAIVYGVFRTVEGVGLSTWSTLFLSTPSIFLDTAYDYLRVAVITAVSLAIASTVGYYVTVNPKVEKILIPLIQVLSSYPAPLYFPLLFFYSYAGVSSVFGAYTAEFYVLLLGFLSTFYYVFFSFWMGVKSLPQEYWELMKNVGMNFPQRMRYVILPSVFPYLIAGLSSTVNSTWGGLMIGEYWPDIYDGRNLYVTHGLMGLLASFTSRGEIPEVAWGSLVFAVIVVLFSIFFTRRMMDLARTKYVAEEGIYAA